MRGRRRPCTRAADRSILTIAGWPKRKFQIIGSLANPWGDATDFRLLRALTEADIGCLLGSEGDGSVPESRSLESVLQPLSESCAEPSVWYCGPGTSQDGVAAFGVSACLNEACCEHDLCYESQCIETSCLWSPQSQDCDDSLTDVCNFGGSCLPNNPDDIFVCSLANSLDLAGTFIHLPKCFLQPECVVPSCPSSFTVVASDVPLAIPDPGQITSTLTFPLSGPIACMELFFQFTHQCERDLTVDLISPDGRTVGVMDRGLMTCTGTPQTFTSINTQIGEPAFFGGREAAGEWKLIFADDRSGSSGTLDTWQLSITVRP